MTFLCRSFCVGFLCSFIRLHIYISLYATILCLGLLCTSCTISIIHKYLHGVKLHHSLNHALPSGILPPPQKKIQTWPPQTLQLETPLLLICRIGLHTVCISVLCNMHCITSEQKSKSLNVIQELANIVSLYS